MKEEVKKWLEFAKEDCETAKIIKIHDLVILGKKVGIDEKFLSSLEKVTYIYVDSRYPDIPSGTYTRDGVILT